MLGGTFLAPYVFVTYTNIKNLSMVLVVLLSLTLIECKDRSLPPVPPQPSLTKVPEPKAKPVHVPPVNYYRSKYSMLENIYNVEERRVTFYCECKFDSDKSLNAEGCGHPVDEKNIMLWEHVVPAYVFGRDLPEWKNWREHCVGENKAKGRKCARKLSKLFNKMEGDMYNLYPSVDYLNNRRGHLSFGELDEEANPNSLCGYDLANHIVDPRDGIKGEIARAYLYMDNRYPQVDIIKSEAEKNLYLLWDELDPVNAWECERACMIEKLQGNENIFIKRACEGRELYKCK